MDFLFDSLVRKTFGLGYITFLLFFSGTPSIDTKCPDLRSAVGAIATNATSNAPNTTISDADTNPNDETQQEEMVFVCISTTSRRYHKRMCHGVTNCTHEIRRVSISEAWKMGKDQCKICY